MPDISKCWRHGKSLKEDTRESITEKYFASRGAAKLADYNGYEVSQNLTAGDLLKIPTTLHIP